jgi:hypothetical protein
MSISRKGLSTSLYFRFEWTVTASISGNRYTTGGMTLSAGVFARRDVVGGSIGPLASFGLLVIDPSLSTNTSRIEDAIAGVATAHFGA